MMLGLLVKGFVILDEKKLHSKGYCVVKNDGYYVLNKSMTLLMYLIFSLVMCSLLICQRSSKSTSNRHNMVIDDFWNLASVLSFILF